MLARHIHLQHTDAIVIRFCHNNIFDELIIVSQEAQNNTKIL